MKQSDNNLDGLIREFVDDAEAQRLAEEIRLGDALIARYASPAMRPEARAQLRKQVKNDLSSHRRRAHWTGWAGAAAAVAAAVALVVVLIGTAERPQTAIDGAPVAHHETAQSHEVEMPPPEPQAQPEPPRASLNLWDEGQYVQSNQAFWDIQMELDNIAAWIEAVGVMDNVFPDERTFNGETASQKENDVDLSDFWKG